MAIGPLASRFALGSVGFLLPRGALIRRFSAKTTLVLSLAGYAAAVGVFPFLQVPGRSWRDESIAWDS